jgi:hypothetical protein
MPVQDSGFAGAIKRRSPLVDAPYDMPLKENTPLRLDPRTLPWAVSVTVNASELITRPRRIAAGAAAGCATAISGKSVDPTNPADTLKTLPTNPRRPSFRSTFLFTLPFSFALSMPTLIDSINES